ncbi:MAG TPA: ATP-binding protein [Patescibacteria group bacterium]|nr:ATP-binding protein [Patescibacteria group bacterium]
MNPLSIRIPEVELKDLARMRAFVMESTMMLGGNTEAASELKIAVNEALTNIIIHGYQGKPGFIEIFVERDTNDIRLSLLDNAAAFDPTSVKPPDITIPLEQRPIGGMGIQMMRSFTDELDYRPTADGMNELIFIKRNAIIRSAIP